MNRWLHGLTCLALALVAHSAQAQGMQAHVLIIDNAEQANRWLAASPEQRGGDNSRLRTVPVGKKVMLPVIVTGIVPANEVRLQADFEFLAPDGKVIASAKACCRAIARPGMSPAPLVLQPIVDVTADPGDMPGVYSVRYTVTDGNSSVTATEKFTLLAAPGRGPRRDAAVPDARSELKAAGKPEPEKAPAAPALRSGGSAPGDRDMRHCLSLPTQAEILKCAGHHK